MTLLREAGIPYFADNQVALVPDMSLDMKECLEEEKPSSLSNGEWKLCTKGMIMPDFGEANVGGIASVNVSGPVILAAYDLKRIHGYGSHHDERCLYKMCKGGLRPSAKDLSGHLDAYGKSCDGVRKGKAGKIDEAVKKFEEEVLSRSKGPKGVLNRNAMDIDYRHRRGPRCRGPKGVLKRNAMYINYRHRRGPRHSTAPTHPRCKNPTHASR